MVKYYDIVIIGAGPAGTAAAIKAASSGLSVMMLEARPFPRSRPGETLHPGIESLFKELGVLKNISRENYARPGGFFENSTGVSSFMPYNKNDDKLSWKGWLIPRDEMDACLLERALVTGADLRYTGGNLKIIQGSGWQLQCSAEILCAKYIFDASGHNFWLSRQIGNPLTEISKKLITVYGKVKGDYPPASEAPCFYKHKNGWTWIARVEPSVYQWTHLNYSGRPSADKYWRPPVLQKLNPVGISRSRDVTWRKADKPSGRNYFCLGDAAFITDPSTSQGVLKAIMSGMMAAHLTHLVMNKKTINPQSASGYYSEWIGEWLKNEYNNNFLTPFLRTSNNKRI